MADSFEKIYDQDPNEVPYEPGVVNEITDELLEKSKQDHQSINPRPLPNNPETHDNFIVRTPSFILGGCVAVASKIYEFISPKKEISYEETMQNMYSHIEDYDREFSKLLPKTNFVLQIFNNPVFKITNMVIDDLVVYETEEINENMEETTPNLNIEEKDSDEMDEF